MLQVCSELHHQILSDGQDCLVLIHILLEHSLVEAMGSWNSKSSQAPSSSQSDEEERHVLLQTRYTEKEQLCIVDVLNPRLSKCPNAP